MEWKYNSRLAKECVHVSLDKYDAREKSYG